MKINTDPQKIKQVLEQGVEEIIEKDNLKKKLLSGKKLRIKHGIDPTGPKIHIGRALQLWKLKQFQDLGHQVVLIFGDFTAQIGDASDKTAMRKPLTEKEVKKNLKTYKNQIGKILNLSKTEIHRNSEWLKNLPLNKLLNIAMHFTAQQMIQRRNFKERWEENRPIGVHELIYPILQGYDSLMINSDVEIGGSDQLFNLKIGREIQRLFNKPPQDIIILKMLTGLDGRKMSTSWGNVVNITDSPKEMFGKIMSMRDEVMIEYFELCSFYSQKELNRIKKSLKQGVNPRDIKYELAEQIVKLYHGPEKAVKARQEFERVFQKKSLPQKIPVFESTKRNLTPIELIFETHLAPSKSEAKRLIVQGGVKINGIPLKDWKKPLNLKTGDILQVGKRKFLKIKVKK